jgi:glucuronate isomerase
MIDKFEEAGEFFSLFRKYLKGKKMSDEEFGDFAKFVALLYEHLKGKKMSDKEEETFITFFWYELMKKNNPDHPFFMDTLAPVSLLFDDSDDPKVKKQMVKAMKKGKMGSDPFL